MYNIMDDYPIRTKYRHRRGANNIHPLNPIEYTVRTGFSASDIKKHHDKLNSKKLKNKAFTLAQKKAKADGQVNYAKAIPSLDDERGYKIGMLCEVYSNIITSKDISLWTRYCQLNEEQQKQSRNPYNVQFEESRPVGSNFALIAKWILYMFATFIALVFLNLFFVK